MGPWFHYRAKSRLERRLQPKLAALQEAQNKPSQRRLPAGKPAPQGRRCFDPFGNGQVESAGILLTFCMVPSTTLLAGCADVVAFQISTDWDRCCLIEKDPH